MSEIKLLHGDCLELMKDIPDKSIDMILTDPPYGTTACSWDSIIPFDKMWEQLNRIIKDDGAILLFGSEPFSSLLRVSNIKNYKYDWIWDKITASGMVLAKIQPMKEHEIISVFGKNKLNYFPIMEKMNKPESYKCYKKSDSSPLKYNDNMRRIRTEKFPKSILKFSNANHKDKFHPTQKPVPLLEYLIKTYTQENEVVLDFTMGSGSTGVVCKSTNRNFIGIELDENYFNIAKNRIEGKIQRNIEESELNKFLLFQE